MAICMMIIATVLGVYSDKTEQAVGSRMYPGAAMDVSVYITDDVATFAILLLLCLFIACFALSWQVYIWKDESSVCVYVLIHGF